MSDHSTREQNPRSVLNPERRAELAQTARERMERIVRRTLDDADSQEALRLRSANGKRRGAA